MVGSSSYIQHLRSHADKGNEEVQAILALKQPDRRKAEDKIRDKAIMMHNMDLVNKGEEPIRNRNQLTNKKGKGCTVFFFFFL